MVETHWPGLEGKELRYDDETWALTGDVEVRGQGDLLAVAATATTDIHHDTATLYFEVVGEDSLNPGNLGERFAELEHRGRHHRLRITNGGPAYRYELTRIDYD